MIFRKKILMAHIYVKNATEQRSVGHNHPQRNSVLLHFLLLLLVFFNACTDKSKHITTAFYHWKREFNISDFEKKYLDSCYTQKMYVRVFDVDWDDGANFPKPIAPIRYSDTLKYWALLNMPIVPTVFITNKNFSKIPNNQLDTLAFLISKTIQATEQRAHTFAQNTEGATFSEIQIDCDWTASTRDKYFSFLKKLNSISQKKISSTIRLHQIKDRDIMGIPPVDRGMLMAYNMGDLDNPKNDNAIIDIGVLKNYVKTLKSYPLSLDIALPLFSWGVVLRDGEAVKIINNLSYEDLYPIDDDENSTGIKIIREKHYQIEKNMYFKGHYLYKDDEIRLDNTPLSILTGTATILNQHLKPESRTVCFYHADLVLFNRFRYEDLQDIVHRFQ
jgi:hypothetical protein